MIGTWDEYFLLILITTIKTELIMGWGKWLLLSVIFKRSHPAQERSLNFRKSVAFIIDMNGKKRLDFRRMNFCERQLSFSTPFRFHTRNCTLPSNLAECKWFRKLFRIAHRLLCSWIAGRKRHLLSITNFTRSTPYYQGISMTKTSWNPLSPKESLKCGIYWCAIQKPLRIDFSSISL